MSADTPTDRFRENAVGITSTLLTGLWLVALFTGQGWWLPLMLFSYIVVLPIVAMLFGDDEDRDEWWNDDFMGDWGWSGRPETGDERERTRDTAPDETPLETLRRRYAEGELTDAQFEAKLERLMETDTLENVEERAARRERDRLRERERDREPEFE